MGGCGCEACVIRQAGSTVLGQAVLPAECGQRVWPRETLLKGSKASPPRGKPLGFQRAWEGGALIHGGQKCQEKKRSNVEEKK